MKTKNVVLVALATLLIPSLVISQNTRFSDPDTVVNNEFWGKLYAQGGNSFFCDTPFERKGFVLTEGYVYPLAEVRNALGCGTSSQCDDNDRYRQIASDLHNMVPVRSRIEMSRRNAIYEELGDTSSPDECGIRESAQFFEPPQRVKGDIARTVACMVDTYDLPWAGASRVFKSWNQIDPPDDRELVRHRQVADIQGNENPFVLDPVRIENL